MSLAVKVHLSPQADLHICGTLHIVYVPGTQTIADVHSMSKATQVFLLCKIVPKDRTCSNISSYDEASSLRHLTLEASELREMRYSSFHSTCDLQRCVTYRYPPKVVD